MRRGLHMLNLVALACGAVGLFGLGLRADDKIWRTVFFVLAASNLVVMVVRLVS
jgi:predicted membrane protein